MINSPRWVRWTFALGISAVVVWALVLPGVAAIVTRRFEGGRVFFSGRPGSVDTGPAAVSEGATMAGGGLLVVAALIAGTRWLEKEE